MFEKRGLLLKPGTHNVIIRADGFFPAYHLVEIEDGQAVVLDVELRPEPE